MTTRTAARTSAQVATSMGLKWATKLMVLLAMINILRFESNVSEDRLLLLLEAEVPVETEADTATVTVTASSIHSHHDNYKTETPAREHNGNSNQARKTPRSILETGRTIDPGPFPSLSELVRAEEKVTCPEGLLPVALIANQTADRAEGRLIPKAIHMTGEGKCLTETFYKNTLDWSLEGHSFYFHDARAKEELLSRHWPEFPHLQNAFQCLKNAGGAAISDLWRYLLLWQYGGIYTDMDNGIGKLFNATSIGSEVDGYFLRSNIGLPSQYFFGIAPKHPLMWYAVNDVLQQMMQLEDVGTFYVPGTTGPRCMRRAWLKFVGITNKGISSKEYNSWAYPTEGIYKGKLNDRRTVNIVGNDETREQYVRTSKLHWAKKTDWKLMNYTDYYQLNKVPRNKTCLQVLFEQYSR